MQADLALFKACSDPTRLRLLFLLALRELCVCELVEVLEVPQGKISRHLAILKQAQLVRDRRDATWIYYSLAPADSPLRKHLRDYLKKEAAAVSKKDRTRLQDLAAKGQICAT